MTDENDQLILSHYKKIAKAFGDAPKSTMEDLYVRESEINFIVSEIQRFINKNHSSPTILDMGCGNGYVLSVLREKFPKAKLIGLEFTPELFEIAKNRNIPNAKILHGDCRISGVISEPIDIIYTERVIINLLERRDQYSAFDHISSLLKEAGLYIMIESFREPLNELNLARREMALDDAKESYQNKYLYERMTEIMAKKHLIEIEGTYPPHFLSTHFYITRVFHKAMRPTGGKVKFSRFAKFFREALPPSIGNYSPILFRVFQKKSELL